jgi:hypothetical protein
VTLALPVEWTDLDRRIWQEELDEFVPHRIFDVHTHLYSMDHYLEAAKEDSAYGRLLLPAWKHATVELANACDEFLMPGREVRRLSFPFPFPYPCDFVGANEFLAEQLRGDKRSAGLMLVHPKMTVAEVEQCLDRHRFVGFKPYRNYALSGDIQNCRISEFMPEQLVEVADRRGLIIMMHVSKRDAIADPENLEELQRFSLRYPRAKWILAHCARSYSAWAIERAALTLRDLKNVWYDVSSVCETDAMMALLSSIGSERVMYGSDDLPIGMLRGKYITFGYAWGYLSETNHQIGLQHCDSRMTFTRYEQLRAMRRAAHCVGLSRAQIQSLFFETAANLVESAGYSAP